MNLSFTAFGVVQAFDLDAVCRSIRGETAGHIECVGPRSLRALIIMNRTQANRHRSFAAAEYRSAGVLTLSAATTEVEKQTTRKKNEKLHRKS
jgi:hypothetical protein